MRKLLSQTLKVGILVCPGYFPGDVAGAHMVFGLSPNTEIHFVWKTLEPVEGFPRWPTMATTSFADCPDLNVLIVGAIPPDVIADPEVITFFRQKAEGAAAVLTVCAGAMLAGVAGLLEGRRVTTNFHLLDALHEVGAIPVGGGKVVVDGKFYSAGPATGSFEAALVALAALRGEELAKLIELVIEYDPHPPFKVGSPELAGTALTDKALAMYEGLVNAYRTATRTAYKANRAKNTD